MSADRTKPETNREAFARMAREAREEQKHIPEWMRTPPTEPTAWNARNGVVPARPSKKSSEQEPR